MVRCSFLFLFTLFDLNVGIVLQIPVQRKVLRNKTNETGKLAVEFDKYGQRLSNNKDIEYKGVIQLGNQKFTVVFDTGSDVLWVPAAGCRSSGPFVSSCRSQTNVYNATKSPTSRKTGQNFSIEYGTGSASGAYYLDTFAFGDPRGKQLKLKRPVTFGAATRMSFSDEGILGLSFQQKGSPTPIFQQAVQEKLMDKPIFTTWMRKCDGSCQHGGLITFGGYDHKHCGRVRQWASVDKSQIHWSFNIDEVSAGNYRHHEKMKAITDTGTSFIIGPNKLVEAMAKAINAEMVAGAYIVSCNQDFQIALKIGHQRFSIEASQMLLKDNGLCILALSGSKEALSDRRLCVVFAKSMILHIIVLDLQERLRR
ncbi:Aspartic protease [Aphelenchoides besseyi]|nr:Aspartic protease [Aphelenchoides besseyi]KAI6209883.1 Aspartic protease [Aphelenchoides besseyi]